MFYGYILFLMCFFVILLSQRHSNAGGKSVKGSIMELLYDIKRTSFQKPIDKFVFPPHIFVTVTLKTLDGSLIRVHIVIILLNNKVLSI